LAGVLPGTMATAGGIVVALLLMAAFVAYERRFLLQGLLRQQDTPTWLVLIWVPVLFIAGSGLAYPHLSVATMSSTQDPEEGRRATACDARRCHD
jgi:Sec-independent protein secretion pathway component TatC